MDREANRTQVFVTVIATVMLNACTEHVMQMPGHFFTILRVAVNGERVEKLYDLHRIYQVSIVPCVALVLSLRFCI